MTNYKSLYEESNLLKTVYDSKNIIKYSIHIETNRSFFVLVEKNGFEPLKLTQQIYSLPPLATRELLHGECLI